MEVLKEEHYQRRWKMEYSRE